MSLLSSIYSPIYFGVGVSILGCILLFRKFRARKTALELVWLSYNKSQNANQSTSQNTTNSFRSNLENKSFRFLNIFNARLQKLESDLNLIEVSPSQQAYIKIRMSLLSILVASIAGVYTFRFLGIVNDSNWWFVVIGIFAGVVGFIFPDRKVRELAAKRREVMRISFSSYLDLVKILLAGGSHVDGALFQAASVGNGWAFSKLKASIDGSRVYGEPTHVGLKRLALETGVKEIEELATVTSLADTEGANLKETLTRKAELLTVKILAEATAKSHVIAERMSLPTVVIAMSFMVFIAYPALASLTLNS